MYPDCIQTYDFNQIYTTYSIQFNSILYSAITIQLSLGALQSLEPEPP